MLARRLLFPLLAVAAVLLASCGSGDPAAVDAAAGDELVLPGAPADGAVDPDADPAGGGQLADEEQAVAEVVTGRVVSVDGTTVEIVESVIATGADATDAARAAGEIGPDEEWDLDFYVTDGGRRTVEIDPDVKVAIYDCTGSCEHVSGTIEHLRTGAPYGGTTALWDFFIGADGQAMAVDELYLP